MEGLAPNPMPRTQHLTSEPPYPFSILSTRRTHFVVTHPVTAYLTTPAVTPAASIRTPPVTAVPQGDTECPQSCGRLKIRISGLHLLPLLLLLACAVRPGPAQVTLEPVVEWTAPGDVAELRWTGNGWAAWLPAEGAVVYWPAGAPKDASPVRWSDERWQSPRAWAVTDGTVWLATPTELLAFSEGSSSPSTRMAWPEGATVWDDGRRLWVGHTSDDVRICSPVAASATPACWSFPVTAVRPDFSLPAWDWSPPWWCGLRVGESDAEKARPAEIFCQRGLRMHLPAVATDPGGARISRPGSRPEAQGPQDLTPGPQLASARREVRWVTPTVSLGETLEAMPPSPVFSRMNTVSNPVNTPRGRAYPWEVVQNGMGSRWVPQWHEVCRRGSDVLPTDGRCARRDVRWGRWPYAENPCEGGWAASTLRWWASVSAVAAGEGPRAKGPPPSMRMFPSERLGAGPSRAGPLQESRRRPSEAGTSEPPSWRRSFRIPAGADVTVRRMWIAATGVFVSTGRWAWLWDLEGGRPRWRLDLGASVTVPPVQTAWGVLIVATRGLLLYALDARNGNRLWVLPLRAPVTRMRLLQDTGCEGRGGTSAGVSAWVVLTLMDAPPMIVDVATGKTLWQATGWTAWDAAVNDDATVAWAGADRKIRVFQIRPQPTVRGPIRP
ncbi:hypothetical protein HRbin11_01441 [bacterium HR11]|nr:hypothetical protein HRbin11_01441 [bacterium HR11]